MAQSTVKNIHQFIGRLRLKSSRSTSINIKSNRTYQSSTSLRIERHTIENIWKKQMNRIVKYCQMSGMNLKNSSPYILDLLPELYQTLTDIINCYDNRLYELNSIEYFHIFICNINDLCTNTINCFKHYRHHMYDENSTGRKYLIKLSLYFSHNLAELKSLFVNGIYQGEQFRLTKQEAVDFWKKYFNQRIIIPWEEFIVTLDLVHPIQSYNGSLSLKNTIDLTGNNHVSIFEFDVFTRLFHPWSTILNNWKSLTIDHPGFVEFMTYDEVKEILTNYIDKPGSYVFRLSCTRLGQWAIGYVTIQNTIIQVIPQAKSLIQALIDGKQDGYYKYPNGKNINIDLKSILSAVEINSIKVSEEQYKIYSDAGSTFELCKICSTNNKDCKIQPCGHLLCQSCLVSWQNQNIAKQLPLCPFCRSEIKGFESVIIDKFPNLSKLKFKKSKKLDNKSDVQNCDENFRRKQTSSDNLSSIAPPIPPRPIGMRKSVNETSIVTERNSSRISKQHFLPPLQMQSSAQRMSTTSNDIKPASLQHSIKNRGISRSEATRHSYDFDANSNSQVRTVDHIHHRLKIEDNFDEQCQSCFSVN